MDIPIYNYVPLKKLNIGYLPDYRYYIDFKTIPVHKFTHIVCGFLWLQPNQNDYNIAKNKGLFDVEYDNTKLEGTLAFRNKDQFYSTLGKLKDIKIKYPHLKIIISIGGSMLSWNISKVLNDNILRENLIYSICKFVKNNDIDGVDIDWEFPGTPHNSYTIYDQKNDIPNFKIFLKDLRTKLIEYIPNKYIELFIASGNYKSIIQGFKGFSDLIDYMLIMTYDYSGTSWNIGNPHTALNPYFINNDACAKRSVELMEELAEIPKNKICIGAAGYSYGWEKLNLIPTNTSFYGTSFDGVATNFSGVKNGIEVYRNIVSKIYKDSPYKVVYDNNSKSVSLQKYNGDNTYQVWSYEDNVTVSHKADYILQNGLAGMINWEITHDDLSNNNTSIIHSIYNKFL